ncbi:hypothetical protein GW931_01360 [archaeon]|nr:hypothetical protein [archaeon]
MAKAMESCDHKGKSIWMLVLGILILLNVYWPFLSWGGFVGAVLVLGSLLKLIFYQK